MPRTCSVCSHPAVEAINHALVAGEAAAAVSARYRTESGRALGRMAMQRHRDEHVPEVLAKAQEAAEVASANSIMAELRHCLGRVHLLFDACDRWLRDPEHPEQYDVGPRAEDVKVIYTESGSDGRLVRKRAPLSELLARLENHDSGLTVERGEWRHADPRELVLKTSGQVQSHLELLLKLVETGELEQRLKALEEAEAQRQLRGGGKHPWQRMG